MQHKEKPASSPSRIGWIVFIGLAVLTVVEYIIAVGMEKNLPILMLFAILKGVLIARYFMHIVQVWRSGEGH